VFGIPQALQAMTWVEKNQEQRPYSKSKEVRQQIGGILQAYPHPKSEIQSPKSQSIKSKKSESKTTQKLNEGSSVVS